MTVSFQLVGNPCGQRGPYTFYRSFRYRPEASDNAAPAADRNAGPQLPPPPCKTISVGDFFFLRIDDCDETVSIGELDLLWEDTSVPQRTLSSCRLYSLPEHTPDGRGTQHGEDEVVAATEKIVVRVDDLIRWIATDVRWEHGLKGLYSDRPSDQLTPAALQQQVHTPTVADPASEPGGQHKSSSCSSSTSSFCSNTTKTETTTADANSDMDRSSLPPPPPPVPSSLATCKSVPASSESIADDSVASGDTLPPPSLTLSSSDESGAADCSDRNASSDVKCVVNAGAAAAGDDTPCCSNSNNLGDECYLDGVCTDADCCGVDAVCDPDEWQVRILSFSNYCRYRGVVKRLESVADAWLHSALLVALGGFTVRSRNCRVLFCRDTFEHPLLLANEFLLNHLAPKLKGRPRKKRLKNKRSNSPSSESNESECFKDYSSPSRENRPRNGMKKVLAGEDLEEQDFLQRLFKFMRKQNTPIDRVPNLGFKQINLYFFYTIAQKLGGYEKITIKRLWKRLYDQMGGNPGSTSAATCTRRHYERLLLPFERHENGQTCVGRRGKGKKQQQQPSSTGASKRRTLSNSSSLHQSPPDSPLNDDEDNNNNGDEPAPSPTPPSRSGSVAEVSDVTPNVAAATTTTTTTTAPTEVSSEPATVSDRPDCGSDILEAKPPTTSSPTPPPSLSLPAEVLPVDASVSAVDGVAAVPAENVAISPVAAAVETKPEVIPPVVEAPPAAAAAIVAEQLLTDAKLPVDEVKVEAVDDGEDVRLLEHKVDGASTESGVSYPLAGDLPVGESDGPMLDDADELEQEACDELGVSGDLLLALQQHKMNSGNNQSSASFQQPLRKRVKDEKFAEKERMWDEIRRQNAIERDRIRQLTAAARSSSGSSSNSCSSIGANGSTFTSLRTIKPKDTLSKPGAVSPLTLAIPSPPTLAANTDGRSSAPIQMQRPLSASHSVATSPSPLPPASKILYCHSPALSDEPELIIDEQLPPPPPPPPPPVPVAPAPKRMKIEDELAEHLSSFCEDYRRVPNNKFFDRTAASNNAAILHSQPPPTSQQQQQQQPSSFIQQRATKPQSISPAAVAVTANATRANPYHLNINNNGNTHHHRPVTERKRQSKGNGKVKTERHPQRLNPHQYHHQQQQQQQHANNNSNNGEWLSTGSTSTSIREPPLRRPSVIQHTQCPLGDSPEPTYGNKSERYHGGQPAAPHRRSNVYATAMLHHRGPPDGHHHQQQRPLSASAVPAPAAHAVSSCSRYRPARPAATPASPWSIAVAPSILGRQTYGPPGVPPPVTYSRGGSHDDCSDVLDLSVKRPQPRSSDSASWQNGHRQQQRRNRCTDEVTIVEEVRELDLSMKSGRNKRTSVVGASHGGVAAATTAPGVRAENYGGGGGVASLAARHSRAPPIGKSTSGGAELGHRRGGRSTVSPALSSGSNGAAAHSSAAMPAGGYYVHHAGGDKHSPTGFPEYGQQISSLLPPHYYQLAYPPSSVGSAASSSAPPTPASASGSSSARGELSGHQQMSEQLARHSHLAAYKDLFQKGALPITSPFAFAFPPHMYHHPSLFNEQSSPYHLYHK